MNNIGGIAKLEVFLSSDVLQQKLQTKLQLDRLILLYSTKAQLVLQWRDRLSGEYSYGKNQYREDELQVSATVEEYLEYQSMIQTLDRLQGRNLCIVITDLQGDVKAFNPLRLSYKFVGVNDLTKRNRYEISFTRAKYKIPSEFTAVKELNVQAAYFETIAGANIRFLLRTEVDPSLYKYSHGVTDRIQESRECKQVFFLKNGNYYLFCSLKSDLNVYEVFKLNITTV